MYVCDCDVMKKIGFLSLILLVFACSKFKNHSKLLQGHWELKVVRIEDGEGFLFYDSLASGYLTFQDSSLSGRANYAYSYFSQFQVSDSVLFDQTPFFLSADGQFIQIVRPTDTLQGKIIMLTKKQLTFEYYDFLQYRLKRFSLSRP